MFRPAEDELPVPWRALLLVLLIGLALRVGLAFYLPSDEAFLERLPDQLEYLGLAESLLERGELAIVDERYAAPQPLRAQRMPGYPLFVALCGAEVTAVRLAQALIDTLTALAAFLVGKSLLGPRYGLLAGAGVVINPYFVYFSQLILTETAFSALLAWGTVGLLMARRRGWHWWWGIGLIVLSVHLRPTGALLAVAMAFMAALLPGRHPSRPTSHWPLAPGLTTCLLVAIALLPWAIRNQAVLGQWVWTTTNGGITLYDGLNVDNTTGGSDQGFVARMPQLGLMSEVERDAYLSRLAMEEVQDNPWRAIVLGGRKALRTWSPVPLSELDRPAYVAVGLLYSLPLFALAILGVFLGRIPLPAKLLLLTPAVVLTLAHAVTVGSLRYRLPAEPMLCVLAAAGVAALVGAWQSRAEVTVDNDTTSDPAAAG